MIDLKTIDRTSIAGDKRLPSSVSAAPDGATPFGAVMSTVQWDDRGRGGPGPQLAANEMFEAPQDLATRRKNALRGNARLDALRPPSRARVLPEAQAHPGEIASSDQILSEAPGAVVLPIAPPTNAGQNAHLPTKQSSSSGALPTRTGVSKQTAISPDSQSRDAVADKPAAPHGNPMQSAPTAPAGGTEDAVLGTGNLARQVGRVLIESRGTSAVPSRSDAAIGLVKSEGSITSERTTKGGATATSSETADAPAADGPDETPPTRFDDLIRSIQIRAGDKLSSARLQLQPPRLGYMEVDVRMEGDQVHIDVRTETDEARRQVHEQAVQLKSALESAGIDVQQLRVSVDPDWLKHREQAALAWMNGGPRDQAQSGARQFSSPHEGQSAAGADRLDFDNAEGVELPGDAVSSFLRKSRRIDLRV